MDVKERFISHVHKTETCWLWLGYRNNQGYGTFRIFGKIKKSHRISYEFFIGQIPKGFLILHKCDVTSCVNPDHLIAGTQKQNVADSIAKGRFKKWHKLSDQQVEEIRSKYIPFKYSAYRIAKEYGVRPQTINQIILNKRRR